MKLIRFIAVAAGAVALISGSVAAQRGQSGPPEHAKITPVNNLPNPYETVRNWGTLPNGRTWGSVSAIHVDADGKHIWAGDRCGTNSCAGSTVDPIVKLDPTGKVVASFGAGQIIWPHGMDVDRQGNVWIADARAASKRRIEQVPERRRQGPYGHQVQPAGEIAPDPGHARSGRQLRPTHFTEPNDVLVAPNGSIFVGESHNAQFEDKPGGPAAIGRISKFAPDGKFIKSWGAWGYGNSEFRGPHSLAMDSQGRLFVADRGNRRIQIFDQEGKHLATWYQFSRISGLYIDRNDVLYAIDSESDENYNPGWRKGLRVGSAKTGEVWYFTPEHVSKQPSGMGGYGSMGEGVAVDGAGNVYGGEVGPIQGITKFIPRLKK